MIAPTWTNLCRVMMLRDVGVSIPRAAVTLALLPVLLIGVALELVVWAVLPKNRWGGRGTSL